MNLREMLQGPHRLGYDRHAGRADPGQQHLYAVRKELPDYLPPVGYKVVVSGTSFSLPVVPWIAVLDPGVTVTAKRGLYVVYLYSADVRRVFLSLNQGATAHLDAAKADGQGRGAGARAIASLNEESRSLRAELHHSSVSGTVDEITLGAQGFFPSAYEAANVAAISYDVAHLPDEVALRADLDRMLALYSTTVEVRAALNAAGTLATPTLHTPALAALDEFYFRPKSAEDYDVVLREQTQRRSRSHEAIVARFGRYVIELGWKPNTQVHPRDLTLHRGQEEVLCEIKVVTANAQNAVREAVGQLLAYRHFYYTIRGLPRPPMLAVFSADVGTALVGLLDELEIGAVWPGRSPSEWCGSPIARRLGFGGSST